MTRDSTFWHATELQQEQTQVRFELTCWAGAAAARADRREEQWSTPLSPKVIASSNRSAKGSDPGTENTAPNPRPNRTAAAATAATAAAAATTSTAMLSEAEDASDEKMLLDLIYTDLLAAPAVLRGVPTSALTLAVSPTSVSYTSRLARARLANTVTRG